MLEGIEHIGIAVKDLDEAEKRFALLLGTNSYKREEVESEGVITSFFLVGNVKIELLAAIRDDSPIAKFIHKKGEGIHHIAFRSSNCQEELNRLGFNFDLLHTTPKQGADGMKIGFIHPKSTHGVLTEICSPAKEG